MTNRSVPSTSSRFNDLTGQVFGLVTVLSYDGKYGRNQKWFCRCECGVKKSMLAGTLKKAKSCGCLNRERSTTHGMSKSAEYAIWSGIIQRCYNSNRGHYCRYGGRGVTVCDRWRSSFEDFLKDMGGRPSTDCSIDRIDNSKGYSPENCRWATLAEQNRNKRNNRNLSFCGKTQCLQSWEEETGVPGGTITRRIDYLGWTVEKALSTPVWSPRLFTFQGKSQSLEDWSADTGLPFSAIKNRLRRGWSLEKSLSTPLCKPQMLTFQGKSQGLPDWSRELGVPVKALYSRLKKGWSVERTLSTPVKSRKKSTDV